jgi:hypothetical protein
MVFEEYLKTAVARGATYDQLPERVRAALPPQTYYNRCLVPWDGLLIAAAPVTAPANGAAPAAATGAG